ncbi:MAG: VPDSG-CTERM sorting domain-containing protein [Verrucomicrobiota bacterium]
MSPNAISTPSDPVSVGTAYLYSMFAQGSLSGYNYSSTTSAGNLQNTFWFLEGDQPSMPNTFLALLTTEFGSVAAAQGDSFTYNNGNVVNAASFGVAALNLGGIANNWPNQDQLVYQGRQNVPDGGTTLMLLGMAMGGMSLLRRKLS